ncbi:competence type IV pilus major pilin ComGC [Halobacillus litoralis]|uniref:competence type IV pilus major pilin ComGC n=1 Tax=Halobacillus litoralis TaxID=45668 RepID=UPI001CFDED40|nr:competence type IV pilus major pilin ComGC [Halobacillus litoralis]
MLRNNEGFTLIEMLIVLLVISVLLIITIPNMSKNSNTIRDKGCEALIVTAQAQVEAYWLENNAYPAAIDDLVSGEYINEATCPNGETLQIVNGVITSEVPQP